MNVGETEAKELGFQDKTERSVTAIAQELRLYARLRWPLHNDKYRKDRLADLLRFTHRRVKSLWEGEQTAVPRDQETSAIECLIGHRIGEGLTQEAMDALRASQENYRALEARIAALEAALAHGDEEYVREYVDGYRAFALGQGQGLPGRSTGDGRASDGEAE
jgi:hypothetical protein